MLCRCVGDEVFATAKEIFVTRASQSTLSVMTSAAYWLDLWDDQADHEAAGG